MAQRVPSCVTCCHWLSLLSLSPTADVDYIAVTHTVNVSRPNVAAMSSFKENLPNVTITEPFDVTIVSDGVLESLEHFECHIVRTSHSRVLIGRRSSVPVTIVDQDSEWDHTVGGRGEREGGIGGGRGRGRGREREGEGRQVEEGGV